MPDEKYWICSGCGTTNDAANETCIVCGHGKTRPPAPTPAGSSSSGSLGGRPAGSSGYRDSGERPGGSSDYGGSGGRLGGSSDYGGSGETGSESRSHRGWIIAIAVIIMIILIGYCSNSEGSGGGTTVAPTNTVRVSQPKAAVTPTNTVRVSSPKVVTTPTAKLPMPKYYRNSNLTSAMYYYWADAVIPDKRLVFFMDKDQKVGGIYYYKYKSGDRNEGCIVGEIKITPLENLKRNITISDGHESFSVSAEYDPSGTYYFSQVNGVSFNTKLEKSNSTMNEIKNRIMELAQMYYN